MSLDDALPVFSFFRVKTNEKTILKDDNDYDSDNDSENLTTLNHYQQKYNRPG
jgi:hypothetical protein